MLVLTLEMRRGWFVSHPPCIRKPHGEPPKRVTSLALIPRARHSTRHAHPFFPASSFAIIASLELASPATERRAKGMKRATRQQSLSRGNSRKQTRRGLVDGGQGLSSRDDERRDHRCTTPSRWFRTRRDYAH